MKHEITGETVTNTRKIYDWNRLILQNSVENIVVCQLNVK